MRTIERGGSGTLFTFIGLMTAVLAVVVAHGCADGDAIHLPEGHSSLRLVDLVSSAEVSSPLRSVDAIVSIDEVDGIEPKRVVPGQFIHDRSNGCTTEWSTKGELEVACHGGKIEGWWSVPVASNSYARVRLRVRTDDAGCFEVSVQNGKQEEVFLALDPQRSSEWQELSTTVVASAVMGMGPAIHIQSWPGREGCDIKITDVGGEEFELDVDSELGLLKAQSLLPGSDPRSGLAKIGIMMPTASGMRVTAPFDDNYTIAEAILAPAPTTVTYRIVVPDRARLLFAYGPHRGSKVGDAVGFEVRAKRRWRDPEVIWTDVVTVSDESWHWRDARVDLARFAGKTIDLTFRSFAPRGARAYAVWGTPTLDVPREPTDPPNVILIAVDTLRADRLSCYGYPAPASPNIDALAADGVRFEHTFAESNWTRPSFASIFSGLTVEAHGLVSVLDEYSPAVTTLAEILRRAGWSTHAIAYKPALAGRGFEQGFETYFNIPRVSHSAQENLSKALSFLDRNGDRRFFLFLHFNDPHLPYTHPAPFFSAESKADVGYFGIPRPVWIHPDLRNCTRCGVPGAREPRYDRMGRRMYVEEIRYLDDRIGVLIEELERRGLYEDTILVFVSDHGETLWDHYNQYDHGGKNHHDELMHVPLIIKPQRGWGGPRGAVVDTQVRAFDLMPTVLELAGIDPAELDLEAESLAPLLRQPEADRPPRFVVSTNEFASAVRTPSWKYIRPLLPHSGGDQLFDLEADPGEHVDVAAQHPDILRKLRHAAAEHILLRHGGVFVLVVSEEGEHSVRLRWDLDAELDPAGHLGLPLTGNVGDGEVRYRHSEFIFEGPGGADRLALVAGFLVPDGAALGVAMDGRQEVLFNEFPVYTVGTLDSILETDGPGVFAFTSPARSYRRLNGSREGETRVDAEQLEALRTLGYIDGQ